MNRFSLGSARLRDARHLSAPKARGRWVSVFSLLLLGAVLLAPDLVSAQPSTVPEITSEGPFMVDEGETAVTTLTATDTDTTAADLVWSKTGGADTDEFMLSQAGVLAFASARDYEQPDDADGDGTYEVTVQVSDGTDRDSADLIVTLGNVAELTAITGPFEVTFAENSWTRVATFTASSEQDRDGIDWLLSGSDVAHFSIDNPGGALRFDLANVGSNLFPQPPDFEVPIDGGADNTYQVTVLAGVGTESRPLAVTVTVTDVDEDGGISLSTTRPALGAALTATLTDPDGVTDASTVWQWERSTGRNAWAVIDGASMASYTAVAADTNTFLRATATYDDEHGTGKSAQGATGSVVLAHRLSQLQVTTTAARQMYPGFDPTILHYAVGCEDTLTLLLSTEATDTRLTVNGIQRNQNASIELTQLNGESDVTIVLSDATGASTTYVVHCTDPRFADIEVVKQPGAWSGLITSQFRGLDQAPSYIALLDSNGVPRSHRAFPHRAAPFGYHPDGEYPFHFFRPADGNLEVVILDWDLNIVDTATTVPPVTDTDNHDFSIRENGNYIFISYQPITRSITYSGRTQTLMMEDSVIQEVTPGGTQVFLWNSFDHMPVEDCLVHRWPGDWGHMNSLQLLSDGDIVTSMRGCAQVLRIDRETGNVVWRLGRSTLDDRQWAEQWEDGRGRPPLRLIGDPEVEFCGQHAATLFDDGRLLLFDNGNHCQQGSPRRPGDSIGQKWQHFSRAAEYQLDLMNGELVFVRDHSSGGTRNQLSISSSRVAPMDNGHWLISWGRNFRSQEVAENPFPDTSPPYHSITQVDPASGDELLTMRFTHPDGTRYSVRSTALDPFGLVDEQGALVAEVPVSSHTSVFHSGAADSPQVVVSFSRRVVDFDETTPSLSVTGATVASVSAHVVAGEPANAYLVTLTPAGAGAITFRLVTAQACDGGGICTADGTMLS